MEQLSDDQIIENFFLARGWEAYTHPMVGFGYLKDKEGNKYKQLPKILESFPDFKREVMDVMEDNGFYPIIKKKELGGLYFVWDNRWMQSKPTLEELIIDNNILHAAVIAATRY